MGRKTRPRRRRREVERRARKIAKRMAKRRIPVIDLLAVATLLQRHLTDALCEEAFRAVRTTERIRLWSLALLARFWVQVVLRTPVSLTQAFEEGLRGSGIFGQYLSGTPQAFFERSRTLKWTFFSELYRRFVTSITPEAKPRFANEFAGLRRHFQEVYIVDGSRLDAVAHRLRLLWDVRSPVLPGCVIAFYDLFRGYPRILRFEPDAARGEMPRVFEALPEVPEGTLLLGDRAYASVQLFERMKGKLWGLFRRTAQLGLNKTKRLSSRPWRGGTLEDWLVEAGCGATAPIQTLRHIRFQRGAMIHELVTNVLEPRKLSAQTAMSLYPRRWNVERLFLTLKVTLGVGEFYAANPNAVAMQVFAAAMVYTSMRIAQMDAAQQAQVQPEEISPEKLFPRVAHACEKQVGIELGYRLTCLENPGRRLNPPNPKGRPEFTTTLDEVRVEKRQGARRNRRFCNGRSRWKSFAHVPGGKKLIR